MAAAMGHDELQEARQLAALERRLQAIYCPPLDLDEVRAEARLAYRQLATARIRTFVTILAERAASERCDARRRELARDAGSSTMPLAASSDA
jgi:hypothetical protein